MLNMSPAAIQAFRDFKTRFTTASIVHHHDPDKPFIVEVDTSNTGIRAMLSQHHGTPLKLFPCTYFSHKLCAAEQNYDVGN